MQIKTISYTKQNVTSMAGFKAGRKEQIEPLLSGSVWRHGWRQPSLTGTYLQAYS